MSSDHNDLIAKTIEVLLDIFESSTADGRDRESDTAADKNADDERKERNGCDGAESDAGICTWRGRHCSVGGASGDVGGQRRMFEVRE
jgi:hypothetical protein